MNLEQTYDLVVIGGGPAGYAAGIRAGQLGFRALVIEKERAGGTCLNWGAFHQKLCSKVRRPTRQLCILKALGSSVRTSKLILARLWLGPVVLLIKWAAALSFYLRKTKSIMW